MRIMQTIIAVLGVALITLGIAFIYWKAALIFLGIFLVLAAVKGFDDSPPSTSNK